MLLPMIRLALAFTLVASAACTDLAMPSELAAPQILGVRAENPGLPAGERTALDVLVGGPDGQLTPDSVEWTVVGVDDASPPIGSIDIVDGVPFYVAPNEVSGFELATVQVSVTVGERELDAVKAIAVGVPEATVNPGITAIVVDGNDFTAGDTIRMGTLEAAPLEMQVEPEPGDDAVFAWYSNVAEIELFRRTPSEIEGLEEPGTGVVIGVYRDGLGGIDWTMVDLVIE